MCSRCDKQDSFVVRTYDIFSETPSSIVHELPLKLARKCLDVSGGHSSQSHDQAEDTTTPLPGYYNNYYYYCCYCYYSYYYY